LESLPFYYDHLVHNIILVVYVVLTAQFFIASKKLGISSGKRNSVLLLCIIFILCGLTRVFMDLYVTGILTAIVNTVLLIVVFYFVCTNKVESIVESMEEDGKV
jgi:Flp pilus assembly protein TadB